LGAGNAIRELHRVSAPLASFAKVFDPLPFSNIAAIQEKLMTLVPEPYPKVKYYWGGKMIKVANAEEDAALEKGWANTPAAFAPYEGPRPPEAENQDPARWIDEWAVVGLSGTHRNRIKAHLMRVDASFWRSPDAASADMDAMRQAFAGIVKILAEAGILTEELLINEIPELVWDSAIAEGWYRCAAAEPQDIFPEQMGHYWVWRDAERDWKNFFYSETREGRAWLLENAFGNLGDSGDSMLADSTLVQTELPPEPQGTPAAERETSPAERCAALAAYTQYWNCSGAALARTAIVDRGDLSKWKKGLLPSGSDKNRRIEAVLNNNAAPKILAKRSTDV
jgi:hypothetical protein